MNDQVEQFDEFKPYHTDNLMLLVGTNPLPNYVAARLLAAPKTSLHLLVTREIHEAQIHKRLLEMLGRDVTNMGQYLSVEAADPENIFNKVYSRVQTTTGTWGLHYTGGKKVMTTHTYRAMEAALLKKDQKGVFSYFNADTIEIIVDPRAGLPAQRLLAHLKVNVSLAQLLELHGRPLREREMPETEPFQPEICKMLVDLCQDAEKRREWLDFAKTLRRPNGKDLSATQAAEKRVPEIVPEIGGMTLGELGEFWDKKPVWLARWFHGPWLEHYVLWAIQQVASDVGVSDWGLSIKPKGLTNFEVDVVAMQGHRLFAFSVTTDDDAGPYQLNKLKMFEALIRAQQMGGEEAKVALVTFSSKKRLLEDAVKQLWGKHARVKVFDLEQLPVLEQKLIPWFTEV